MASFGIDLIRLSLMSWLLPLFLKILKSTKTMPVKISALKSVLMKLTLYYTESYLVEAEKL